MPRIFLNTQRGYSFAACKDLLLLEEPITPPCFKLIFPAFRIRASLGSSRFVYATTGRSLGISMGISFRLWTARSIVPSRSARSSSFTKRPFPPIFSRLLWRIRSPVVFIVMISTVSPGAFFSRIPFTISACLTASALSLLPIFMCVFICLSFFYRSLSILYNNAFRIAAATVLPPFLPFATIYGTFAAIIRSFASTTLTNPTGTPITRAG